jgi:5,10-methenyltetrahydrofolate synthetase
VKEQLWMTAELLKCKPSQQLLTKGGSFLPHSWEPPGVKHPFQMKSKSELRRQIRQRLSALGITQPREYPGLLQNLRDFTELWTVHSLAGFLPLGYEPDLRLFFQEWLRDGRCLLLPRYVSATDSYELAAVRDIKRDTKLGHYGILEPDPLLDKVILNADLPSAWLVPGLAFSQTGVRLGRGAGYYDRLLEASAAPKIGVCLESQLATEIPAQQHDVKMHHIITEARIIKCQQKAQELAH